MSRLLPLIEWLRANDPALSRLRLALRVTLTVGLTVGLLAGVHLVLLPLPKAAYGLAIMLSIQSGLSVKDVLPHDQLVTRVLGVLTAVSIVALASALETHRLLSDLAFLLVIFFAAFLRGYGARGHAVGMFAFMSYFIGAYLQPPLSDLPLVALAAVSAAGIGHAMRVAVLPDDWRRDLLRAVGAIEARVTHLFDHLQTMDRGDRFTEKGRQRSQQLIARLREAVLMAASFVPVEAEGGEAAGAGALRRAVTVALFDLHVAAESAIVLARQAPPPPAVLTALRIGDRTVIERVAGKTGEGADPLLQETVAGLVSLDRARRRLQDAATALVGAGEDGGSRDAAIPPAPPSVSNRPAFRLSDPIFRTALQITIAAALAMALGLLVSRERWFWAVLSAFLVFTNTRSRGDTAIKAVQRSIGTLFGIAAGLVLATLLAGQMAAILGLAALGIFLAFYLLPVSYAAMAFFVSIVVALVYSLIGALSFDILLLRLEETILGSLAGLVTAFAVLPTRTAPLVDAALSRWTAAMRRLIEAAADGRSGYDLVLRSQAVEQAYAELANAAAPLGTSWGIVTRPGTVRQTLAILMSATYWSRILAGALAGGPAAGSEALRPLAGDALSVVQSIEAKGSAIFSAPHGMPPRKRRHFPLSQRSPILGLDMIVGALARLEPAAPSDGATTVLKESSP